MINKKWKKNHDLLQQVMKKEMEVMRQLLASLYQEEAFILRGEATIYFPSLMEERNKLIAQLRTTRQKIEALIATLVTPQTPFSSLEELLPPDSENRWEILTLRDQIATFLDRISLQKSRNEFLSQLTKHQKGLPSRSKKKSTISVVTLPPKNYNDDHS